MTHLNATEAKKLSGMIGTEWAESLLLHPVAPAADLRNLQSKADKDVRRDPAVAPNVAEIPQFHLETSVVSLAPQPGHDVNPDFANFLQLKSLRKAIVAFCQYCAQRKRLLKLFPITISIVFRRRYGWRC
jgi:hypothetical protein